MNQEQNLVSAAKIFAKWWKHIMGISFIAAAAAAFVSVFVMDEYFLSQTIFYPVNQSLTERSFLFNMSSPQYVNYYGDKNDVNRLLTIANSKPLIDHTIEKFGLTDHYEVDRKKPHWRTTIYKKFLKNYKAIKTEKDAVEISVLDTDPQLAADIVNDMTRAVDSINLAIIRQTRTRVMGEMEKDLEENRKELLALNFTADTMIKNNSLTTRFSEFGELLIEGGSFLAREKARQLFREINNKQHELLNKNNIRNQLEISISNATASLSIIEKAEPADRREKPKRALLVAVAFLIAFIFSTIAALLLEQAGDLRRQFSEQ